MSTESIQFALRERFAAPLQEFYQRRIIFWQDEEREFEKIIDEITIPNVTIIKLTGSNNFAVKKLLVHDDLTGNYLIYNPISYDKVQENWLRDVELYSEEYRADYLSMQMSELNIDSSPIMRKTLRLYAKLLDSKDLRKKFKKIGGQYHNPLQLHLDIMAVLAGLPGGTAQDIIIAVLSDSLDIMDNKVLSKIQEYGNLDVFWQMVRKYTGYIYEDDKPLGFLAAHILLTAQSQTMNASVFKGLERFISESNKAYCYSIVNEWRGREDNEALLELCRTVEREVQLTGRFDKQEIDTLLMGDLFPAIHESVLKKFFSEIGEQIVKTELILKAAENRRTSGWYKQYENYYDCLYYIAKIQQFYHNHAGGFHIVEPAAVWKFYTETGYEMDAFYRRFHFAYANALQDAHDILDDKLKETIGYVEDLYKGWYLQAVNDCWVNSVESDLAQLGYASEINRQRDFYSRYVRPLTNKKSRCFVIISDALRYEVAAELCERLTRNTKGNAKLESMQAVFPSITKFGMAALLPGTQITVDQNMNAFVNGMPTVSTADREKILLTANPKSVAVQYTDLLRMSTPERKKLASGMEVIYIYHNAIDAIGDKLPTEDKVFDACQDAIAEIMSIIGIITGTIQGSDVFITADHGFLYSYSPLNESDKLSKNAVAADIKEAGRRYVLAGSDSAADYMLPVCMRGHLNNSELSGYTLRDTTRLKIAGGGQNYVHGGLSLQECVVPVIAFKNLKANNKNYVEVTNAELTLLSESRKVSNLMFSLDLFQRQPVGDKVQPCVYSVYMTDDSGNPVSDRQNIIADKTSDNASDRVFRVRLNLKAGVYNKKKVYRLVIANDMDVPEEIEFQIDIPFADDFGFGF